MPYFKYIYSLVLVHVVFLSSCAAIDQPQTYETSPKGSVAGHYVVKGESDVDIFVRKWIRLDGITNQIMEKNIRICENAWRDLGIITHDISQYPKVLQDEAVTQFDAQDRPTILHIRTQNSRNILHRGDILLGSNNEPVTPASRAVQTYLSAGFVRVLRAGKEHILPVKAPRICAYGARLRASSKVDARAHGTEIIVSTALMDFIRSDDELAFVIGHELAHYLLGHLKAAQKKGILLNISPGFSRRMENEADKMGLYLMANAGYDYKNVNGFWARMPDKWPFLSFGLARHPNSPSRGKKMASTVREIEQRQLAGRALILDLKSFILASNKQTPGLESKPAQ